MQLHRHSARVVLKGPLFRVLTKARTFHKRKPLRAETSIRLADILTSPFSLRFDCTYCFHERFLNPLLLIILSVSPHTRSAMRMLSHCYCYTLISPYRLTCCRYFAFSPPRLTLLWRLYFHVFGHAYSWIYRHVGPYRRWSDSLLFGTNTCIDNAIKNRKYLHSVPDRPLE